MPRRIARTQRPVNRPEGNRPGFWNRDGQRAYDKQQSVANRRAAQNELVRQRKAMGDAIPFDLIDSDGARYVGDRVVDARNAINNINRPAAFALGAGATAAGVAGLNAYYQQNAEGLPIDGYNVAGRAVNNALAGIAGGVGIDPLAEARNSVRDAGAALGSANLLEAVAADELIAMEEIAQAANSAGGMPAIQAKDEGAFQAQVMQVADQLMQVPIETANGPRPMNYDVAINRAIDIVSGDYRAAGIL